MPSTTSFNVSLNELGERMPDVAHIQLRRETEEVGIPSNVNANRSRVPIRIRNIVEFTLRNQRDIPNDDALRQMAQEVARYIPGLAHAMRNGSDLHVIGTSISTEAFSDIVVTCEIVQQGHRVSVRGHSDADADSVNQNNMHEAVARNADRMREDNEERRARNMRRRERELMGAREAMRARQSGNRQSADEELTLREIFERCGVDRNIYERQSDG